MLGGAWSYFRTGAELDAVKSVMGDDPAYRAAQASISQVALSSWGTIVPVDPQHKLVAQLALGIITRGWPTLATAHVEQALLAHCEAITGMGFTRRASTTDLRWEINTNAEDIDGLVETLTAGLFPIDDRVSLRSDLPFGSEAEYRIFKRVLEPALGSAIGWMELQRPLSSILEEDSVQGSFSSAERVGFAFELDAGGPEPIRLIIEVDGPQHLQAVQARIDYVRDDRTRKAGWPTFRVRLNDPAQAKRDTEGLKQAIERRVRDAPFLISLLAKSAADAEVPLSAALLTRWPHAIQRTQLALLNGLISGRLRFDQETWDIGVIERDARCAALAISDLLAWLSHFGSLYEAPPLPVVRLTAYDATNLDLKPVEATVFSPAPFILDVNHGYVSDDSHLQHDLIVDVAVRAFPLHRYRNDPYERLLHESSAGTVVRTAPRSTAEAITWPPALPVRNAEDKGDSLVFMLQQVFRKEEFREGQMAIIRRALNRQSTIGLLPTGAGKSLTFQLPALISPGMTIVIDPIKSLMQDQVDNLRSIGIQSATAINSDQDGKDRDRETRLMGSGERRFVFISPERLQIQAFRNEIRQACSRFPVAYFVIDEAHCVSEWGHDFRTAYLRIGQLARELCQHHGQEPPILALTATASPSVLSDVQREIGLADPKDIVSPGSFDRKELRFHIVRATTGEKHLALRSLLQEMEGLLNNAPKPKSLDIPTALGDADAGAIVFCPHVNGSLGVSGVRDYISNNVAALKDRVEYYSGEAPKNFRPPMSHPGSPSASSNVFPDRRKLADAWALHKATVQRQFKGNQIPLLVATSAFGMGIDKPNIRYTVHFAMTKTIEEFAQQAGRAGRDRHPALCSVIFSDDTLSPSDDPLAAGISSREALARMNRIPRREARDSSVVMYLHSRGYLGIEEEIEDICAFYHQVIEARLEGQISFDGTIEAVVSKHDFPLGLVENAEAITSATRDRTSEDRVLYRLSILGIISDYTVQYSIGSNVYTLALHAVSETELRANLATYVKRYKLQNGVEQVLRTMETSRRLHPIDRTIEALTTFVYEEIEKKRCEGMANMRQLLRDSRSGEDLRKKITDFLDHNVFTDRVFTLLSQLDESSWWPIIDSVTSEDQASQLLGQCQRALETDPDHPGLRILAGLARAMRGNRDLQEISDDLDTGLSRWAGAVGGDHRQVIQVARHIVRRLFAISPLVLETVTERMVVERQNNLFARAAYRYVPDRRLALICAAPILVSIQHGVAATRRYHLESTQ
jgi:ATP-dependent DNA helicase RecQ